MAKIKRHFVCQSCGATAPKWIGKCPSCGEWNTYQEEVLEPKSRSYNTGTLTRRSAQVAPQNIQSISRSNWERLAIHDEELMKTLGGGVVPGSINLVGGSPGIGKSTLLLQIACQNPLNVLFVSGEESAEQIKHRADRIGITNAHCQIMTTTSVEQVLDAANTADPQLIIVDSIQTMYTQKLESSPGTVSQVRECTYLFQQFAKQTGIPVFIIGHITKDGAIAGPKVLEHIVDVVLRFEGDKHYNYRLLRTIKNRFGSTDALGIYAMRHDGLHAVSNPSALLLDQRLQDLSGSAIAVPVEGQRALMIETQALVTTAAYGTAQRSTTGYELRRLHMLLAVLEKRCGFQFGNQDVFLNLTGGIRIADPAIDMAIIAALISSLEDIPLPQDVCFAGEVGLSGEIRAVRLVERRILEAARMGFGTCYLSRYHQKALPSTPTTVNLVFVEKVTDLFTHLFG